VAVIGDGSLTGGMAFEALNHIGHIKKDLIIILNDNEHSISKNVGAFSEYLTRMISGSFYNRFRSMSMKAIRKIPFIGGRLFNFLYKVFGGFKWLIMPGQFFQDMGIRYFGPIDGHNIQRLIEVFENVRAIDNGPKIIHVITKKGKGYLPAERDPARFHGIGKFDIATGQSLGDQKGFSYSEITARTLAELSARDSKIVAITAAMKLGTGLYEFENRAPSRFFDVGIAEQHAVTFGAALASTGLKPFISIYSTFLQRAVDQLIHDAGIMNLPVKLLVDRSGIVGDDGETHHGLFDIGIIRNIPNFCLLAPSNGTELRDMIHFASRYDGGPLAIRFPRGRVNGDLRFNEHDDFAMGKIRRLTTGRDLAIFSVGDMLDSSLRLHEKLRFAGIKSSVVNLLSIKPLDVRGIERVIKGTRRFITLENGMISGGAGEYIVSSIDAKLKSSLLFIAGFPDTFITHGSVDQLFTLYGIDPDSLFKRIIRELA